VFGAAIRVYTCDVGVGFFVGVRCCYVGSVVVVIVVVAVAGWVVDVYVFSADHVHGEDVVVDMVLLHRCVLHYRC